MRRIGLVRTPTSEALSVLFVILGFVFLNIIYECGECDRHINKTHLENQMRQRRNVCEEGLSLVAVYEWECVSQNNSFCTMGGGGDGYSRELAGNDLNA